MSYAHDFQQIHALYKWGTGNLVWPHAIHRTACPTRQEDTPVSQLLTSLAIQATLLNPCVEGGGPFRGGTCEDQRAIAALHALDAEASRSMDSCALAALWTDDIVSLRPGEPPLRGREANAASLARTLAARGSAETLGYAIDFAEVVIAGDLAYEWGTYREGLRARRHEEPLLREGHVMRVLARQPDGEWKIARTIFVAPTSAAGPRAAANGSRAVNDPALADPMPLLPRLLPGVAPCIEP